ncbi:recombination-associated protein RdgC [Aquimonas sp.]|jgi:recombination associated protein RdgC|uniref:recombination-associated protein RdgC n=1 Tax=Aquimonas sp. TaxID=1872588 RepID=UPI0037C19160
MFFRNLTLFRYPTSINDSFENLEEALAPHVLKPVGSLELSSRGFVSPFGRGDTVLSHRIGDAVLLTLGGEDKLLPGSVVNDALSAKLDHIRETEGRNPGGRERKRIKDEVLTDLLPRAFARSSRCSAYLDLQLGWAIVDSSSRKNAENFVSAVREALGSFPAVPVNAESSPRALMTAWIAGEPLPDGFVLGDECELRDPVDSGAIVKCRRQELEADEVREHLKCGKQAFQLALIFEERLSFVLGEDLVIRKLKFLETVTESLEQGERDSQRDEVDAVFVLMSGELRILLKRLEEIFSFSRAEA